MATEPLPDAAAEYQRRINHHHNEVETLLSGAMDSVEEWAAAAEACQRYANTLMEGGDEASYQAALKYYRDALEFSQVLPNELRYRQGTARSFINATNALLKLNRLEEAKTTCEEGLALSEAFPLDIWYYAESHVAALANKALILLRSEEPEAANDAAETGIALLQKLEAAGHYELRPLRERLFEVAAHTYLLTSPGFLAEFLLEQLNPGNLGSAPDSEAMHRTALRFLHQLRQVAQQRGHPAWLKPIAPALYDLIHIRNAYLLGHPAGAQLNAEYHEISERDIKGAAEELRHYTRLYPRDWLGWQQWAAFCRHTHDIDAAMTAYEALLKLLLAQPLIPEEPLKRLFRAALMSAFGGFPGPQIISVKTVLQEKQANVRAWRGRLAALCGDSPELDLQDEMDAIQQDILNDAENWRQQRAAVRDGEALREFSRQRDTDWIWELKAREEALQASLQPLHLPWEAFVEKLHGGAAHFWDLHQNERHAAAAQEQFDQQLSRVLNREAQRLAADAEPLASALSRLRETMGATAWEQLSADERHLLGITRALIDADAPVFAVLALSLAVENSLLQRLFRPLREQLREHRRELKSIDDFLGAYLNRQHDRLRLAQMLPAFSALCCEAAQDTQHSSSYQLLMVFLRPLPHSAPLLDASASTRQARDAALRALQALRQTAEPTAQSVDAVVTQLTHSEHALFRYLPAALPLITIGETE